jgi:MscS family membrane protein
VKKWLDSFVTYLNQYGEYRWVIWGIMAFCGLLLSLWIIDQLWKRMIIPLTKRTKNKLDQTIAAYVRRPILGICGFGGAYLIFRLICYEAGLGATDHWSVGFPVVIVSGLFYVLTVLAACALGYSFVTALCDWYMKNVASRTNSTLDDEFVPVLRRLVKIAVAFIGITVILAHFDVKITALLGAAGFASLAVALAAQETVANMISGFTILVDRPFRTGDRIELADGTVGDVSVIGLRSTKILSFDNTLLIIPNKEISGARVINHSYPDPKVKIRKNYSVAYGSDADLVKETLVAIANNHPKVLEEPAPAVYLLNFGDSALVFKLICWVGDYKEKFETTDQINMAVKSEFEKKGIEIPFPQQDLHIRSGLDLLKT